MKCVSFNIAQNPQQKPSRWKNPRWWLQLVEACCQYRWFSMPSFLLIPFDKLVDVHENPGFPQRKNAFFLVFHAFFLWFVGNTCWWRKSQTTTRDGAKILPIVGQTSYQRQLVSRISAINRTTGFKSFIIYPKNGRPFLDRIGFDQRNPFLRTRLDS